MEKIREYDLSVFSVIFFFVCDKDFILWIELVFQSFKGNKDSQARGLSWFEKLKNLITLASHDESFMLLNETQFVRKQLRGFARRENSQKGLSVYIFKEKLFFWLFTKEWKPIKHQRKVVTFFFTFFRCELIHQSFKNNRSPEIESKKIEFSLPACILT